MKKYLIYIFILIVAGLIFSGCVKDLTGTVYDGPSFAEIDATSLNSAATGQTFPILTRIPRAGIPIATTADSTLRRWNGTVKIRVNLVGHQESKDLTVGYKIFNSPIATISYGATLTATQAPPTGQTPSQPAATLSVLNAVPGVHYNALSGICTIPANSSFGYIDVVILNAGSTAGQARFIGIQLDSTGTLKPNPNYTRLAITIDQR
jgi:hypothetical protein